MLSHGPGWLGEEVREVPIASSPRAAPPTSPPLTRPPLGLRWWLGKRAARCVCKARQRQEIASIKYKVSASAKHDNDRSGR